MRIAVLVVALAAALWAGVIWIAGPLRMAPFGLRLSAVDPFRPLLVAAVAFAAYAACWPRIARCQIRTIGRSPVERPGTVAKALALTVFAMGVWWGSTIAGGADPYGYVSQAALWRHARLIVRLDIITQVPWPNAAWTFAPLGYRPAVGVPDGIVPTYAPGLPLLMALCQMIAGYCGAFLVAPLAGAATVWLTYALGRRVFESPVIALAGALFVATSPAFLFQLMWPLSDIPATAAWTLSLLLLTARRPVWAAIAMAATIAIRPNLLPLPLTILAWAVLRDRTSRETQRTDSRPPYRLPSPVRIGYTIPLAAGILPVAVGIAWLYTYLYGSPLSSGYGAAAGLYGLRNASKTVALYASWIRETETPAIALAALAFMAPGLFASSTVAFPRILLGGTIAGVTLSYLFYTPFEVWWYLRFLLPMWPVLLLLTAAGFAVVLRVTGQARPALLAGCILLFAGVRLSEAIDRRVFLVGRDERRYLDVARFVAAHSDPEAVIICHQHSGSIRHYAGRLTLRYDFLDPGWLDESVAYLRSIGRRSYVLLDGEEVGRFRERFERTNRLGALDWPPIAILRGGPQVISLYDTSDTSGSLSPALMPADAIRQRTGWPCKHPLVSE